MPQDSLHKLFNEAHEAAIRLTEALERKRYIQLAAMTYPAAKAIDAAHHDYTNLIEDQS